MLATRPRASPPRIEVARTSHACSVACSRLAQATTHKCVEGRLQKAPPVGRGIAAESRARAFLNRWGARAARRAGGAMSLWGLLGYETPAEPVAEEDAAPPAPADAGAADAAAEAPAGEAADDGSGGWAGALSSFGLGGGTNAPASSKPALTPEEEEARKQKSAELTGQRQKAWEEEAASADFAPATAASSLEASMAALHSALAAEQTVLEEPKRASTTATPASVVSLADAEALKNANALLGPGAGGLLPVEAAVAGAQAWDEMEARMAALTAALEGEVVVAPSGALDAAKLEARAARMREREAKRAAKRAVMNGEAPPPASTISSGVAMNAAAVLARQAAMAGAVKPAGAPSAFPAASSAAAVAAVAAVAAPKGLTMTASAALNAQRERERVEAEEKAKKEEAARRAESEAQRKATAAAEAAAKAEAAAAKAEAERAARVAREQDKAAKKAAMLEREQKEAGSAPNLAKAVASGSQAEFEAQCHACAARAKQGTSRLVMMVHDGAQDSVLAGMAQHAGSAEALVAACGALAALAAGDDKKRMRPFCEAGVATVCAALDAHPDASALQLAGFAALAAMVVHTADKVSVAHVVMGGIAAAPEDAELAEVACSALKNAALGEERNRVAAAEAGALEVLLETMRLHGGVAGVCEQACWALKNMCVLPDNQTRVAQMGGIAEVLAVLQTHPRAPAVCEQAIWALRILAFNADNAAAIGEAGGINIIIDVMKAHMAAPGVQETCCGALRTLGANPANKAAVVEAGAAVRAVAAMRRHPEHPAVQMSSIGLISSLVSDLDSQRRASSAGAVEVVVECLRNNPKAVKLHQACFAVLSALVAANSETKARASAAGAVPAALSSLAAHGGEDAPGLAEAALDVVSSVVSTPDAQREALECEAVKRVVAAMRTHRAQAEVAEKACRALSAVVWCLPQAQKQCRKAGVLDELMSVLNRHAGHSGVQKAARALMATIQVEAEDEADARPSGANSRTDPGIATLSVRNPNFRYATL